MQPDLTYLRSLMGNDDSRTEMFLNIYRTEVPVLLQKLDNAVSQGDLRGVSTAAHGIKSQSAYLMADEVVALAKEIEHNADNAAPLTVLRELTSKLSTQVGDILKVL